MHGKRYVLLTAVFALLLVTALIDHRWIQETDQSKAVLNGPSQASVAKANRSVVPPTPAVFGLSEPTEHGFASAPIDERPGYRQQSVDFIVALKDHHYLGLSKIEMEKLLTAYLEVGLERSIYEGSIATVKVISPTESTITIPAYPEAGAKLQDELYRKFTEVLGAERGKEVQAALSPTLYARNYGFGETEQQIKVRLVAGEPATYVFVHSTGTLRVPYKGSYLTIKYGGMDSTHTLDDLNGYVGFAEFLPGGGA